MNIKILVAVKKYAFTISLILTLLSTFTSCSKDDGSVVDKQFANTVWIYRYPTPYHSVYAEALVFFRDGSIKNYGLDSHDKILYHYANYSFRRIDENHISFSDKMNPILVEENRFTFVYYFYKTAYRPEDLAQLLMSEGGSITCNKVFLYGKSDYNIIYIGDACINITHVSVKEKM